MLKQTMPPLYIYSFFCITETYFSKHLCLSTVFLFYPSVMSSFPFAQGFYLLIFQHLISE